MPRKNRGNRRRVSKHKQLKKVNKQQELYTRIFKLLQRYNQWQKQSTRENIYAVTCKHYNSSSIRLFMNDYYYIINNIDNHKQYLNHHNKCDPNSCAMFRRNYRKTSELSKDNKKRILLYDGINDQIQISMMQLIDIIHNTFYHLVHSGVRNLNANNKNALKTRKQNIINKSSQIIRNNNNKFVTHFSNYENQETHDDIKENDKHMIYSQGIRYYYLKRYKTMNKMMEPIPGCTSVDSGNVNCYIYEWYVEPKYCNLKTEILTNKCFTFSIEQWNNTNIKAKWKFNDFRNTVAKACFVWHEVYGYNYETMIGFSNVLCLLLYTNYDFIATELTKTYRKQAQFENNKSLKNRHSYFAHLGQALKETVEVFGTVLIESKHEEFYHGINVKMVFSALSAKFCSPTSTTFIKDVAINFGGNGMLLTIQNDKVTINYFNCVLFSDFPGEAELLFIGGLEPLNIIGLTDLSLCVDYNKYICAIKMVQCCLDSKPSLDVLSEESHNILLHLLNTKISSQSNKSNELLIPSYIQSIFDHILKSYSELSVDFNLFNKQLMYTDNIGGRHYGYIKLHSLFIDSNNWIRLNVLHKLVPQITAIAVIRHP
eukprot:91881_1